jgi:predicted DNA-binding transcriptional regulator YafY
VAWDIERHDWRSFRVDRLVRPQATGVRFRQRDLPGGDALAFVEAGIASRPTRYDIAVTVHTPARDVQRVVQRWGEVEALDDTSCLLRMSLDSFEWVVFVLAVIGADFEVLEPVELRDHLRATGEIFSRGSNS